MNETDVQYSNNFMLEVKNLPYCQYFGGRI